MHALASFAVLFLEELVHVRLQPLYETLSHSIIGQNAASHQVEMGFRRCERPGQFLGCGEGVGAPVEGACELSVLALHLGVHFLNF